jgi:hypothetical protein
MGLSGVIKCGDSPTDNSLSSNKLIGDPQKPPTDIMYNVLKFGWFIPLWKMIYIFLFKHGSYKYKQINNIPYYLRLTLLFGLYIFWKVIFSTVLPKSGNIHINVDRNLTFDTIILINVWGKDRCQTLTGPWAGGRPRIKSHRRWRVLEIYGVRRTGRMH